MMVLSRVRCIDQNLYENNNDNQSILTGAVGKEI